MSIEIFQLSVKAPTKYLLSMSINPCIGPPDAMLAPIKTATKSESKTSCVSSAKL